MSPRRRIDWGLRDYGTATWEGGDPTCDHKVGRFETDTPVAGKQLSNSGSAGHQARDTCPKCGARRVDAQLGLEPTPELYVERMAAVFREVRRVLRDDGVVWLNMGDSYCSAPAGNKTWNHGAIFDGRDMSGHHTSGARDKTHMPGLKPKDLCGIPWRLALALQADGWWLRSALPWLKRNPMPESTTDRPTTAVEYVFLFSKGQWKSRVIKIADLPCERFHCLQHLGLGVSEPSHARTPSGTDHSALVELCVRLASAVLQGSQLYQEKGLLAFYAEIRKERADGGNGDSVGSLPVPHRAASLAARFLCADASAKEFLCEMYGLGVTLAHDHNLLIGGIPTKLPNPPCVFPDGETAIAVHHSGQICKFDVSHGTIILQSPRACNYFYDAEAVKVPGAGVGGGACFGKQSGGAKAARAQSREYDRPDYGTHNLRNSDFFFRTWQGLLSGDDGEPLALVVNPRGYKGAHFATFPPGLVEPCIKAGTSERGACPTCGKPWERVVEKKGGPPNNRFRDGLTGDCKTAHLEGTVAGSALSELYRKYGYPTLTTLGWRPTCDCPAADPVPCLVLDPFAGSGTTLAVALQLGRHGIGCELNTEYVGLAVERIQKAVRPQTSRTAAPAAAPLFEDREP